MCTVVHHTVIPTSLYCYVSRLSPHDPPVYGGMAALSPTTLHVYTQYPVAAIHSIIPVNPHPHPSNVPTFHTLVRNTSSLPPPILCIQRHSLIRERLEWSSRLQNTLLTLPPSLLSLTTTDTLMVNCTYRHTPFSTFSTSLTF